MGSLLLWLSGVVTFAALLIAREAWARWWAARRDPNLPPVTRRQIRAAHAARLPLPDLNHHPPDDDTPTQEI